MADKKSKESGKKTDSEIKTVKREVATYSVEELKAAAGRFGTTEEVVVAALTISGKENVSMEEAEKIVNDFLKKEVK